MEEEAKKMMKVWSAAMVCLCYCFMVGKLVRKGIKRLILVTPVVIAFFLLPLEMTSVHLGGTTAFFLAWLTNFKLFLFALGRGPLSPTPPLSLPFFLALSCFPINIHSPQPQPQHSSPQAPLNYAIKASLLILLIKVYDFRERLGGKAVLALYALHIYIMLELILAATAGLVRATLGMELEPQFREPYLATSLQDFWGRRWNLMVSTILRPTVYHPTLRLFSPLFGHVWARLPAVFTTFLVSALMHELIFYYIGRMKPDWHLTWFFLIHGFCTTAEIAAKRAIGGRWRLPTAVARVLTVGFMMGTAVWLFLPVFERCNIAEKAFQEYAAAAAFLHLRF